jgi:hypothetical protein
MNCVVTNASAEYTLSDLSTNNRSARSQARIVDRKRWNTLSTLPVSSLQLNFLKFSELPPAHVLDTTRRYTHVGGARSMWRSNVTSPNAYRPSHQPAAHKKMFVSKSGTVFRTTGSCNPQVKLPPSAPRLRLKSNPLPPFVSKSRPLPPIDEDDDESPYADPLYIPRYFDFIKPEHHEKALKAFSYDAFLDDTENQILLSEYRRRLINDGRYAQSDSSPILWNPPPSPDADFAELELALFTDPTPPPSPEPTPPLPPIVHQLNMLHHNDQVMVSQDPPPPDMFQTFGQTKVSFNLEQPLHPRLASAYPTARSTPEYIIYKSFRKYLVTQNIVYVCTAQNFLDLYNEVFDFYLEHGDIPHVNPVVLFFLSYNFVSTAPQFHAQAFWESSSAKAAATAEPDSCTTPKPEPRPEKKFVDRFMPSNVDDVVDRINSTIDSLDVNSLNQLRASATKLVDSVDPAKLTAIQDSAHRTMGFIDTSIDKIQKVVESLTTACSSIAPSLLDTTMLIAHIASLLHEITMFEHMSLPLCIFKTLVHITSAARILIPHLMTIRSPTIAQSYTPTSFLATFLNPSLFLTSGKYMNSIAQIERGLTSLSNFKTWIFEHMPKFLTDLIAFYFPDPDGFQTRFKNFVKSIYEMSNTADRGLPLSTESIDLMIAESTYFDAFLLISTKSTKDANMAYMKARPLCSKLYDYYTNITKYNTPRLTPFSIVFHGESRVGKSVLMNHIATQMANIDDHKGPTSYVRNTGCDFWDGYRDTVFAVIYDDWLQDARFNDVPEFFSLVTKSHFGVPVASLTDKSVGVKGTLCLSPLVLAATNLHNFHSVSSRINSTDALVARINLRIEVVKKPDSIYDDSGKFAHHIYYVVTDNSRSSPMTYDALMIRIVTDYTRHMKGQAKIDLMTDTVDSNIDELRKIRHAQSLVSLAIPAVTSIAFVFTSLTIGRALDVNTPHASRRSTALYAGMIITGIIGGYLLGQSIVKAVTHVVTPPRVTDTMANLTVACNLSHNLTPTERSKATLLISQQADLRSFVTKQLSILHRFEFNGISTTVINKFIDKYDKEFYVYAPPPHVSESREEGKQRSKVHNHRTEAAPDFTPIVKHSKFEREFFDNQEMIQQSFPSCIPHPTPDVVTDILGYAAEGSSDNDALILGKTLSNQVYPCTLLRRFQNDPPYRVNFVSATHISDQHFLLPKHFLLNAEGEQITRSPDYEYDLVLTINNIHHTIKFNPDKVKPLLNSACRPEIDGVLYDMRGTSIPLCHAQLNRFLTEKDLPYVSDNDSAVMVGNTLVNNAPTTALHSFKIKVVKSAISYEATPGKTFYVNHGVTYDAPTSRGDCGSLIILHKPTLSHKILGYHVFGSYNDVRGGAIFTTQEMLRRSLLIEPKSCPIIPHSVQFSVTPSSVALQNATR